MQVTEIETALERHDYPVLEAAFRALVAFPAGARLEGVKTVDTLCSLLTRVSRTLLHDPGAMPPETEAFIVAVVEEPTGLMPTYAGGALVVSEHEYRWRGRYLQHAANGGAIG